MGNYDNLNFNVLFLNFLSNISLFNYSILSYQFTAISLLNSWFD